MKKTVGIIGGGASGMMAAITAAKHGADVTILEHTDRIGKKILVTGNGKCNFTNRAMDVKYFYGQNPAFAGAVLAQFSMEDTLSFFKEQGLFYKEKNGYFYPTSNQASGVLDVLRFALRHYGVKVCLETEIQEICPQKTGFLIKCKKQNYDFQAVILACGSQAAPKTGSDGSGYQLAQKLGHTIIPPVPALVQLKSSEDYFKSISGIRLDAVVTLSIDGKTKAREVGELQITDYGISGIPVFQVSRIVARSLKEKPKVPITVWIDTMPEYEVEALTSLLYKRCQQNPEFTAEEVLQGFLNKKLNLQFLKMLNIKVRTEARQLTQNQMKQVAALSKNWQVPISGTNGFSNCQVCAGGVSTEELTEHCESKLHKDLYLVGELVDIDGICGGYNLQWAWSSGYAAGAAAAE